MSHTLQTPSLFLKAKVIRAVLLVFSTLLIVIYFKPIPLSLRTFPVALGRRSYRGRPSILLPNHTCIGTFSSATSEFSDKGFPDALLRDAYLDLRLASQRDARHRHGTLATQRIMVAVTLHLSVQIQTKNVTVRVRNAAGLKAFVDDVREIESHSKGSEFEYVPGKTTTRGFEVYEWQLIVTLQAKNNSSDFEEYVRSLADDARSGIDLEIPLERFDGKKLWFRPKFAFGCVFGWDAAAVMSAHAASSGSDSSAVLFCANSLSGRKKEQDSFHGEIAHWAARSLQGVVRFDAVVLPIIVDRSMSECSTDDKGCMREASRLNRKLFERVSDNVVAELDKIGVEDEVYKQIVLIPFCRLGTHATGMERRDACSASQRYGQMHNTLMPYALLGKFYKWATLYDLDEYIAMTDGKGPMQHTQRVRAGALFDDMLRESEHMTKAAFTIAWLNFQILRRDVSSITHEVLRGRSQTLVPAASMPSSPSTPSPSTPSTSECYDTQRVPTGKAVVRRDVGLGFTVHQPLVHLRARHLAHVKWQVSCRSERVRVWHARLFHNPLGACMYQRYISKPQT
ncbi:unnamed protein product [Agarophyton chilense]|eukprot:gb/GEZJ01004792.1/.p1 GENE.gb/GEZJ01004792.1/~~gb/GEZJ01004792.1/.p1  ORF type:complete len:568 (+),score=60.96 gb/GEZJ01004792.1/:1377-3080(+)